MIFAKTQIVLMKPVKHAARDVLANGRHRQRQHAGGGVVASRELDDADLGRAGLEHRRLTADGSRRVQSLLGDDSRHLLAIDEDRERRGPHVYDQRPDHGHVVFRRYGAELDGRREPVLERLEQDGTVGVGFSLFSSAASPATLWKDRGALVDR